MNNDIESLDQINSDERYFGEVVYVDDSTKMCRIKVKVISVFDNIPTEYIPYAYPKYLDSPTYDLPYLGEVVDIIFDNNDIYTPLWYRKKSKKSITEIEESDYKSSSVVFEKDLSKFDLDGYFTISYDKTKGLYLILKRNYNESIIVIDNDNNICLTNGNSKQSLQLFEDNISIGSKEKSQQPAVVGDDNKKALEMLNTMVNELFKMNKDLLDLVAQSASSSPYTKHLSIPIKKMGKQLKELSENYYNENDNFFPETQSKVVTIDKTNENE